MTNKQAKLYEQFLEQVHDHVKYHPINSVGSGALLLAALDIYINESNSGVWASDTIAQLIAEEVFLAPIENAVEEVLENGKTQNEELVFFSIEEACTGSVFFEHILSRIEAKKELTVIERNGCGFIDFRPFLENEWYKKVREISIEYKNKPLSEIMVRSAYRVLHYDMYRLSGFFRFKADDRRVSTLARFLAALGVLQAVYLPLKTYAEPAICEDIAITYRRCSRNDFFPMQNEIVEIVSKYIKESKVDELMECINRLDQE